MKDHDLLEAVGDINEKFINNASKSNVKRHELAYGKWIVAAACACIVIGATVMIPLFTNNNTGDDGIPNNNGGYASVEEKEDAMESAGDYAPMVMVDGIVYVDTGEKYEGSIDDRQIKRTSSYTDAKPEKDGEQNFDRSSYAEYFVIDKAMIAVNIDSEWRLFGASRNGKTDFPDEYLKWGEPDVSKDQSDPTYGVESEDVPVDDDTYSEARDYSEDLLDLQERISAAMGPGNELSFVTESGIFENPDRIHVFVDTTDEESINLLKSYNTRGVILEIEYSANVGIAE